MHNTKLCKSSHPLFQTICWTFLETIRSRCLYWFLERDFDFDCSDCCSLLIYYFYHQGPLAGPGVELARRPPLLQSLETNRRPPFCRGSIPVSRRRGPWRLLDSLGISTCTNTPFGLGFGVNVEAVEAMPCPEISSFLLSQFQNGTLPCSKFLH